jgi:hypothetical protein
MATLTYEQVIAKADKAEALGRADDAAKLRAYAETLKAPAAPTLTREQIEAKAAKAEALGRTEDAAKLRAYAETVPAPEAKPLTAIEKIEA